VAKKFVYKGFELEQLQKMTLEEFAKLIPTKSRRLLKRMNHPVKKFLEKFRKHKASGKQKPLRTHFREMVVLPEMVGSRIQVYAGNVFADVNVVPEMLGRKLGEYAITTKLVRHSGPGIGATRGSKSVELK
jgi:small subunit ribosomal protein S19